VSLFVIFGLVTFFLDLPHKISMTILWIFYFLYLISPIFYELVLMNSLEAIFHNIIIVGFFAWILYLHILEDENQKGNQK
jgi:hypothetical protein